MALETALHNITPDRVVFCYREGDTESLEVAEYYSQIRDIPPEHLIPLPCSSSNLISQSEMISTIEQPLLNAINEIELGMSGMASGGDHQIWVIILGFHIPHGYYPNNDTNMAPKAIASRLHRLGQIEYDKVLNYTYNRRGDWKFFDYEYAQLLYITAVIDGPTKQSAIKLIDRSLDVSSLTSLTGLVYVDPYGLTSTAEQIAYQNELIDFSQEFALSLGLEIKTTSTQNVMFREPTFDYFSGDAFYWGWYENRFSQDLFLNQNQRRVFMYNADNDSAADITQSLDANGSDPWCNLSINLNPGYANSAGAISTPGIDAYLRPRPFFDSLQRGASIGEAFLFASPRVDWKLFLIGDPLTTVLFPAPLPSELDPEYILLPNNEMLRRVKESIEEGLAYSYRQRRMLQEILQVNLSSDNFSEELYLVYALNKWAQLKDETSAISLYTRAVTAWVTHIQQSTSLTLDLWLTREGEKVSEYFNNVLNRMPNTSLDEDFIYPEGEWQYQFQYVHPSTSVENVYFEIQIANDSEFTDIEVSANSRLDISGWKYESNPYEFVQLSNEGLFSNFSGRHIRFVSPEAKRLVRTEIYYARWRALNASGDPITEFVADAGKMIVKR